MTEPGDRVGAISHTEGKEVHLYGYGVYEGDEVPPRGISLYGVDLHENKMTNPKIRLDNLKVVWGCECWWGPEEQIKKQIAAFENVVNIDIIQARAEAKNPA